MASRDLGFAWLRRPATRAAGLYFVLASLWIFASDELLSLFVHDTGLLAAMGLAKGIVFVAVTTILLYILLDTWNGKADSGRPVAAGPAPTSGQRGVILTFLVLAVLVPLVGAGVVRLEEPHFEDSALNDLRAISDLKASQIESWLNEWRADADVLMAGGEFAADIDKWRRNGDTQAKKSALAILESYEHVHHYEIELLDAEGRALLAADTSAGHSGAPQRELFSMAMRSGRLQFSDLYRDDSGRIRYDLVVPLLARGDGEPRAIGVAVMHAPVEQFLFPLIQTWPTPSPSGETVLVRREGDSVLFLNELRHRKGTALSFGLAIDTHTRMPAAIGLLQDKPVTVRDGIDYRDIPVLAAVRPIQGTSWHLVTKLDRNEVLAPLRELIWWVSLLALVAVAAVALAVVMLWRQQQRVNRLQLAAQAAEALAEREREFRTLAENVPDNIIRYDTEGRVRYLNKTLERTLGSPAATIIGKFAHEIVPAGRFDALEAAVRRVAATGAGEEFEQAIPVPGGETRYHAIRIVPEPGPDGRPASVLAVGRDVTEHKRAEERTRQAATVFESTRDSVVIADLDGNMLAVNKAFTDITGYSEPEALGQNPRILRSGRQGPEFYQSLWRNLLSSGQWQGEIWNRRKNGEVYPAWMTISAVRNAMGEPTHYVCVATDISQLKRSEEELAHLAHYDPLTDLPNRLLLQSRLAHAIDRAQRRGERAAVLFIDLDRFKTVNDSLGHIAGDQLLVEVAKRLRARVRDEDTLGRFGGDEFLLVLEPIDEPQAAAGVATDLLATLTAPFRLAGGNEIYIGASIGISIYPDDGADAAELLRDADAAMYQAKDQGRNRFCFYTADMNANAVAQLELEAALRRALERGEYVLYYQPQVDLRTGQIDGAEALIRWQDERQGLVSPATFIPLAEKTGLIVPVGAWVIDAACRQLRAWQDAGLRELRLAVNVSGRQFHAGNLTEVVAAALTRHDVAPGSLELELTESILMEDPEATIATLLELKRIGVKLSLDDFGTGYSSFAYLSRFPIDALKIDQSFVRDIVTDPQAATIAVAIIDLAHRLGLTVVAEGVETEAQLGYLRQRDCDTMQGYHFAPPLPLERFETLLYEGRHLTATAEAPLRTLLLVDDEPNIIAAMQRLLRREGYRILTATSARQGLELLATNAVQVIVSDQRMPEMTGTEFLTRVKDLHPDTVRLVLTGYTDLESVTRAVNGGAIYKFLHKPWDDAQMREHIRDAFLYYEAVVKPRAVQRQD